MAALLRLSDRVQSAGRLHKTREQCRVQHKIRLAVLNRCRQLQPTHGPISSDKHLFGGDKMLIHLIALGDHLFDNIGLGFLRDALVND